MNNMSGQATIINVYGLINEIEFEAPLDGVYNWEITECFNGCTVKYTVSMLNFEYLEELDTLMAKDLDDYILGNMTNLSVTPLNVLKAITVHNDKEFTIIYDDGYILIKGLQE